MSNMIKIPTYPKAFGEALKKAQLHSGLAVKELSNRLDCDLGYLYELMRGENTPSLETVSALEEILSLPVGYLYGYYVGRATPQGTVLTAPGTLGPERTLIAMAIIRDMVIAEKHEDDDGKGGDVGILNSRTPEEIAAYRQALKEAKQEDREEKERRKQERETQKKEQKEQGKATFAIIR